MYVEQLYTGCLAEAAYYIESEGEAAVVDPLRESAPYLERAEVNNAKIKYVLETHFHADFVSGHLDLAKKTGAKIVFGPTAQPNYEAHVAEDGEELQLGKIRIKILHTPGHTMESTTFLLIDEHGANHAIFTGDTLFIGDVGRPDLAVKTDLSEEDLAGHLFDSLRNKVLPLEDDIIVYPAHGKGSACGKLMSDETVDSLGHQKKFNYALRADMSKEEFIKEVLTGLATPPQYFPKDATLNKMGYESFDDILARGNVGYEVEEFIQLAETQKAIILDTRPKQIFAEGFIPGSIFIGLEDNFAPWVGALITDMQQPILLVNEEGKEEEAITRLARVGYDNPIGYLKGGFETWKGAGKNWVNIDHMKATQFAHDYQDNPNIAMLDVRRKSEFDSEHIVGAQNFPLDFINDLMGSLEKHQRFYLYCRSGYRSAIACSILRANGFENLVNIESGFEALLETDLPRTEFKEPITML